MLAGTEKHMSRGVCVALRGSPALHALLRMRPLKERLSDTASIRFAVRVRAATGSAPEVEMCAIVDEHNQVIDSQPRSVTVKQRLLGRGAYVLVFNGAGDLLVSKRTMSKDVYPGHLDVVVAGIVRTGEEYQDTAARELHEELGIPLAQAARGLQPLGVFPYSDRWCQVFRAAFKYVHDVQGDQDRQQQQQQQQQGQGQGQLQVGFKLQEEEVEWARWVPLQEVELMLGKEQFTPVGRHILALQGSLKAAGQGQ